MSACRLCEAYGAHQHYCELYGYPIGVTVAALIAEARQATLAEVRAAVEADIGGCVDAGIGPHCFRKDDVLAILDRLAESRP